VMIRRPLEIDVSALEAGDYDGPCGGEHG